MLVARLVCGGITLEPLVDSLWGILQLYNSDSSSLQWTPLNMSILVLFVFAGELLPWLLVMSNDTL